MGHQLAVRVSVGVMTWLDVAVMIALGLAFGAAILVPLATRHIRGGQADDEDE